VWSVQSIGYKENWNMVEKKKSVVLFALVALVLGACATVTPVEEAPQEPAIISESASLPVISESRIAGSTGVELAPHSLVLTVVGSLPQDISDETDLSGMVENLPPGLSLKARAAKAGDSALTLILSGIPRETRQGPLVFNQDNQRVNPQENYIFDIAEAAAQLVIHQYPVEEPWRRSSSTDSISGVLGKPIVAKDVVLTLKDAVLKELIKDETPVDWITNLPAGLDVTALRAEAGATTVTLIVSGTPRETKNEALAVTIPAQALTRDFALVMGPNEDIRFEIVDAAVAPVLIGGAVGHRIPEKDVVITLTASSLREDIAPGAGISWITNLPAGLSARAKGSKAGDSTVTITVGGTPTETRTGLLAVTVPPGVLDVNVELTVSQTGAKYDIGDSGSIKYDTQAFSLTNPNWRGSQNSPTIPTYKDFEGVGIVRVTSQMTETLGPDNKYYWAGESVTYGKLMAEAQRLGAHAIINAAIESDDRVNYTKVTKYLEEGHEWTAEERSKIQSGVLKEVTVDGKQYTEETVRVTTRNYTGTALAIKYTSGIDFYDVEKLKTDAQRAVTVQAEAEKAKADAERAQAEAEKAKADAERAQAEAARARAEADAEQARVEAAKIQAAAADTAAEPKR
jgi:hypothetical protein